jgi:probable F420-dependent oxidoreductase
MQPDAPLYDPLILLGWIAAVTERIRLATNVYILPLRHPVATARSVVTLDRISQGRVTLGIGVGWLEEEFDTLDQSFHDRGRRTDEIIPLLRRLWTEDTIEHEGEHYRFGPIKFEPKPKSKPFPPIEIGGSSTAALRRAGRLGDGWIEIGATTLDDLREHLSVVQSARREAARQELPFEVTTTFDNAGDIDAMQRARDIGVTRIITGHRWSAKRPTLEDHTELIERFAETVITKLGDETF